VRILEKISQSLIEYLKPVKIYYDDIETICDIFRESGEDIEIIADVFKIDILEDILKIEKPFFTNLSIYLKGHSVYVRFSNNEILLHADENTPVRRGLYEKLKSFLKTKRRPFASIIQWIVGASICIGFSFYFFLWGIIVWPSRIWSFFIGIGVLFIGLLWLFYGFRSKFKQYSIIIPSRHSEKISFWSRNKDQIIVAFITAVLSIIGTIIVTRML